MRRRTLMMPCAIISAISNKQDIIELDGMQRLLSREDFIYLL